MPGLFQNFIAGQQAGQQAQEFAQQQEALARQQQFNQLAAQYLGNDTVQTLGVPTTGGPPAQAQAQAPAQPVDESQGPPQYPPQSAFAAPPGAAAAPPPPDPRQQMLSQLVALDPGRALELEKVRTARAQQQQGQIYNLATRALDSGRPAAMLKYLLSADTIGGLNIKAVREAMTQQGVDINAIDDDQATSILQSIQARSAAAAGIQPDAPFSLDQGATRFSGSGRVIASVASKPQGTDDIREYEYAKANGYKGSLPEFIRETHGEAPKAFETLTPQQIADAGLPAGTAAQRDRSTGKIDVLSKRDTTNSLSQKDATAAKIKLNQVKIAKQQLAAARERFSKIKGTYEAGPGQLGSFPTKNGKLFDKAIDTMRGSITALTRTPGVGSMSDYETRLDQSKFPSRSDYEDVTEQQINDLELLLNTLEGGYTDLLGGNQAAQTPEAKPQSRPTPNGKPVPVKSRAEALKLPPGTLFVTPDGRTLRRQ